MRLSLRVKIVGGFVIMLLLIALLGWVTFSQFASLRDVQEKVFDEAVPGLVVVDEIVRSYTAQSAAVRGALIGDSASLLMQYRTEVGNSEFWEDRARGLFRTGEERRLLEDLVLAGEAFHELVDSQVIPLAQRGERSRAFRVLGQEGSTLIVDIERLGALLRDNQRDVMLESERAVRANSNRTIITLALVVVTALFLGVLLAIALPRRLVANLSRLVEVARDIERGNLDQKVDIRSRDEVGELAARFTDMQVGLKRLQQLAAQDRELEIAAQIQRNLLQRHIPEVNGARVIPLHRQANRVGGDWYDVDVRGNRVTVAVGDASGKGIGAALMATLALGALRSENSRGADAKRAVESANRALREATDPESFTTLLHLTLDTRSGEVTWMNMGHSAPFALRRSNDGNAMGFYLEGPRNRVLGWFDDPGFDVSHASLAPGDRIVIFTDGFFEAKSPEGETFGEHRLAAALTEGAELPTEDLLADVVSGVENFAAGKLDDDLTMLVVEYQGAADPPSPGSPTHPSDPAGGRSTA